MDEPINSMHHYKPFFLTATGLVSGLASHLYGFLASNKTAVVLGNLVLIVSLIAGLYSLYTNHKLNKLNDKKLKELEQKEEEEENRVHKIKKNKR